jgi:hypothetical protein
MGMYMVLTVLPEEVLAAFRKHPNMITLAEEHDGDLASMRDAEEADEFDAAFFAEPGIDELEQCFDAQYDFDRHWAGIHYLFTGRNAIADLGATTALPPLARVIVGDLFGEADITTFGHTPLQLVEIAPALEAITLNVLEDRFDPAAMSAANIYPDWWDDPDCTAALVPAAWDLRTIVLDAARDWGAIMGRIA